MLAPVSRVITASSLMRFPAVEIAPETMIEPAATMPVPLKVMSELAERSAPDKVSVPPPALLEMVSASLNRMSAEIVSRLGEPLSLLMDTAPSESSMIRSPFVPPARV